MVSSTVLGLVSKGVRIPQITLSIGAHHPISSHRRK